MDRREFLLNSTILTASTLGAYTLGSGTQYSNFSTVFIETKILSRSENAFIQDGNKKFLDEFYERKKYLISIINAVSSGNLRERWVSRQPNSITIISSWKSYESYIDFKKRTLTYTKGFNSSGFEISEQVITRAPEPAHSDKFYYYKDNQIIKTIYDQFVG